MRTLLDAADSACVTRRKPSRPTQPYCSRSCSICLRRLGALRFSSHAVSDCRPIGRRLVYHSRRIALSSPNSSCAQENSAYGTSLFIRIYSVAFLTSAPAQMLFPLLPCIPQSYTGTSGCRRTRETSRKAYCRVLPHPYAARVARRLTGFPPCTRCSPPNFIGSHTRISSISAFASCKRYSLPAFRRASSAIAATPSTACVCVWSSRCV